MNKKTLYIAIKPVSRQTKLFVMVSKKVFKTAVIRNRAKRVIREAYRNFVLSKPLKTTCEIKISSNLDVLNKKQEEIIKEIEIAFKKYV